jgi:hypothetical protein
MANLPVADRLSLLQSRLDSTLDAVSATLEVSMSRICAMLIRLHKWQPLLKEEASAEERPRKRARQDVRITRMIEDMTKQVGVLECGLTVHEVTLVTMERSIRQWDVVFTARRGAFWAEWQADLQQRYMRFLESEQRESAVDNDHNVTETQRRPPQPRGTM